MKIKTTRQAQLIRAGIRMRREVNQHKRLGPDTDRLPALVRHAYEVYGSRDYTRWRIKIDKMRRLLPDPDIKPKKAKKSRSVIAEPEDVQDNE